MKRLTTIGSILTLGILLTALNIGGSAGCGGDEAGGGGGGGGSGDSSTATDNDAYVASAAAVSAAMSGLSAGGLSASQSAGALTVAKRSQILDGLKETFTVTAASSCTEGGVPDVSGDLFDGTFSGSAVAAGGTGSCTVKIDGTETETSVSVDAVVDCTDLAFSVDDEDGNPVAVAMNGAIGYSADLTVNSETDVDLDLDIGSEGLTMDIGDLSDCSININFPISMNISGSTVMATIGSGACVSACGEAFSFSGSETITVD